MKRLYSEFIRDEAGATAIEYGLVVSGITIAILGTLQALSTSVKTVLFDVIAAATSP
jgi:pilus assembly protein Flp/PilA